MPAAELEGQFRDDLRRRYARYDGQFLPTQSLAAPHETPDRRAAATLSEVEAGLAALASGDRKGAEAALERAQGTAGKDPGANAAAAILFLTGELALASREAEPGDRRLRTAAGVGRPRRRRQPDRRPRIYDGYDVRVRLALAEIHRKNPVAAEQHLRRAIAFDPTRVEPHALLVELYTDQHRETDRLAEMDAALALEPQTAKLAKELVLGLGRAQRPGRVVDVAPIAIFIDPGRPRSARGAGTRAGDDRKAGGGGHRLRARAAVPPVRRGRHSPRAGRHLPHARRSQEGGRPSGRRHRR